MLLVDNILDNEPQIAPRAFQQCDPLAKLTIPDSVTHIGECAFENCSDLQKALVRILT